VGLPIAPLLSAADEIFEATIPHALRFTARSSPFPGAIGSRGP